MVAGGDDEGEDRLPMIHERTPEESKAAGRAVTAAYIEWSDRHGIDAEEGTEEQLAELDALIATAGQVAVRNLRRRSGA